MFGFFNVIDTKKPEKNIEANFQTTQVDVMVFKKESEMTKNKLAKEMGAAQANLDKCIKENNMRLGMILLKKVKAYQGQIDKITEQMQMADFLMIDLHGAQTAKKMNDLQVSAVGVYKGINSQLKVDKIRNTSRNLERERELFKQKSEDIDEINNSMVEDMALGDDDNEGEDSDPLMEEYNRMVEMQIAKDNLDNQSALVGTSALKSTNNNNNNNNKEKDDLSSALDDILGVI